jgi:long-chain acyl-CoA synthetase
MTATIVFQGRRIEPAVFDLGCQRAAAALHAAGVREGGVVAMMMRNSPVALELMLAVRALGAQWCAINWHFKTDEVAYILADSGASVFVVDEELLAGLPGLQLGALRAWAVPRGDALEQSALPSWRVECAAHEALLQAPRPPRGAMFYTSGTTGLPKGIRRAPSTPEQVASGMAVVPEV